MTQSRVILFDLDGTIVENTDSLLKAFRNSFEKLKKAYPGDEAIISKFGKDLSTIMEELNLEPSERKQFAIIFHENMRRANRGKVVCGMKELLDFLKQKGFRLGLVTSKSNGLVRTELQELDLNQYFDAIVDESSTEKHKPNPDPLLMACRLLNVKPSKSILYIGDSKYDALAALNAGLSPQPICWGVHRKEDFLGLEKTLVPAENVDQLKKKIEQHYQL